MPPRRPHNYDTTSARRQAKRRAKYLRMEAALARVEAATTLEEAQSHAREGLRDDFVVEVRDRD